MFPKANSDLNMISECFMRYQYEILLSVSLGDF